MNDCKNQKLIFVIDDDPVMRISCRKILKKEGYTVETFEDGSQGLTRIEKHPPDLLVVDLKMPKIGGLEVIKRVKEIAPDVCIVVITGYATIGTAIDAMKAGAYDFLPKPFTPDELRIIIARGLERSELTAQSKRLKAEKEKLERRYISFVSHQLQSPLVAVQQYLEVLKYLGDGPNTAERQKEWIERSLNRIKEMLAIVRDWLSLARIESHQLVEALTAVSIPTLITEVIQSHELEAQKNNINLVSEIAETFSPVHGHIECLRILFSNLIGNAIKYNKNGGSVIISGKENSENVFISIHDTGMGIPAENLELIFEEFYRVKNAATKHISGTGLGLPICKKIVNELGGSIEVSSQVNTGTTFTIRLLINAPRSN